MSIRSITTTVMTILTATSITIAFSSGPPDGVTGGPGEGLCTQCHLSNPANVAGGSLTLTVPASYLPGDTLTIDIDLQRPGQSRWGFEITALDASNAKVGTLLVVDAARTQKSAPLREYIKHTTAGTDAGTLDAAPGWSVRWASPATNAGTITFYAAGNAANNNGFSSGDFIYTASAATTPLIVACCVGTTGNVDGVGNVDIADLTFLVDVLFINNPTPPCPEEANVDGTGNIDIADLTLLVDVLFINTPPLPLCP